MRELLADLPGELIERPWRDFGSNRTEALQLARGRADYVFVIDADEVVELDPDFRLPRLTADAYLVEMALGGFTYPRRQLVRDALPWRYEGVLHEYIVCEQAGAEAGLKGIRTIVYQDGSRSRDPNTSRRDALCLEEALIDDPDNARVRLLPRAELSRCRRSGVGAALLPAAGEDAGPARGDLVRAVPDRAD